MSKRVELVAPFTLPALCCVCLQPAATLVEAHHSQFIPLGPVVHVTSSEIRIPFCALHAKQTRLKMKLCKYAMVASYLLLMVTSWRAHELGDSAFESKHAALWVMTLLFFSLAIFFGFFGRAQMPVRLKAAKTAKDNFIGSSQLARVVLECDSETFANAVMQANKQIPPPLPPNGTASQHLSLGG